MKRTLLSLSLLLALPLSSLHALPVDLSIPPGGLGPTSDSGSAIHWTDLTEIDFGNGLTLPLRLSFLSSRKEDSPDFGLGHWRTPLHDSRLLTQTPNRWPVLLPCGKVMPLFPQPGQPDTWATADAEWVAKPKGPNTLVSREDGWEMEFNKRGQLIRLRTDTGRNILWSRAPDGSVRSLAELIDGKSAAPAYTVTRDPATGRILSQTARTAHGLRKWSYDYDAQSRLAAIHFPDTSSVRSAYTDVPSITITGRDLVQTSLTWNRETRALLSDGTWAYTITPQKGNNPLMARVGPYGETDSYQDDELGARTLFTSAEGTQTLKQKVKSGPAKGKLESVTRRTGVSPVASATGILPVPPSNNVPTSSPAPQPTEIYRATYDPRGLLATETDALGHTTTHSYTLHGSSIHNGIKTHTVTAPAQVSPPSTTTEEFDKHGNLIASTNALGHATSYQYDSQNRRTHTLGPDATLVEALTYNTAGQLATRTDALGATTTFGYDSEGNRTTTTDALGHTTRAEYDKRGNRTRSIDALGRVTTYQHDGGGRVIRMTLPAAEVKGPSDKKQAQAPVPIPTENGQRNDLHLRPRRPPPNHHRRRRQHHPQHL